MSRRELTSFSRRVVLLALIFCALQFAAAVLLSLRGFEQGAPWQTRFEDGNDQVSVAQATGWTFTQRRAPKFLYSTQAERPREGDVNRVVYGKNIVSEFRVDFGWPWRLLSWRDGLYVDDGVWFRYNTRVRVTAGDYARVASGVLPSEVIWSGAALALLASVALAAILCWAQRWLVLARRRARGRCLACGYPLTGVHAARCPECGQEFGPAVRSR